MITIIVPCYNEEESLSFFYPSITQVLNDIKDDYEIIFVDDGSKDKTLSMLKEFANKDYHVKYLSFSRNFGKESAMYAGFCNAKGDYVAVMDADMQDPPSLLSEMLDILKSKEYDSVATRRVNRKGEPPIRSWFARRFYKLINKISDADIVDGARDFRLMRREMVDAIIKMSEYNRFSKGIFGWIGFKTYWLTYENVERVAGETKWNFFSLLRYAIDGIVDFSQTPLKLSMWLGSGMTFISFFAFCITLIYHLLSSNAINSIIYLIYLIGFIFGMLFVFLGIIGRYIGKIYLETKMRPHYIISKTNMKDIKFIN